MKKTLSLLMALLIMAVTLNFTALAEESAPVTAQVFVTISDGEGKLVMTQQSITVNDINNDGVLSIDEAFYAAHEAKYVGGAAAGYASENTAYGLSLVKLWGVANGGSYGYYVNNQSAMGLTQAVKDGDHINAYAYTDLSTWSDKYCFFDAYTVSGKVGDEVTIKLSAAGYDEQFNPITTAVEGATILIDGEKTEYKTDTNGKVTVKLEKTGSYVISAASDTMTLVPPVCMAEVEADAVESTEPVNTQKEEPTDKGCGGSVSLMGVGIIAVMCITSTVVIKNRKDEE
jgi:hypothetical protein